ncbi:MAG: hypothetical protein AAGD07_06330 [Planctomycetota bacterium]
MFRNVILLLSVALGTPDAAVLMADSPESAIDFAAPIRITSELVAEVPDPKFVTKNGKALDESAIEESLSSIVRRWGFDRFTRDSMVAPFALDLDSIPDANGRRVGHLVDVVFVVHVPLNDLRDEGALRRLAGINDDVENDVVATEEDDPTDVSSARRLTPEEIASHNLPNEIGYARIRFPLIAKLVLSGVAFGDSLDSGDDPSAPIIIRFGLDPSFTDEAQLPDNAASDLGLVNAWAKIERDDRGAKTLGAWQSYEGLGGYLTVVSVPGKENASLIHLVLAIHEPKKWFNGAPLLRSKLPLVIQDRVRGFRREIAARKSQ